MVRRSVVVPAPDERATWESCFSWPSSPVSGQLSAVPRDEIICALKVMSLDGPIPTPAADPAGECARFWFI
jgi:hypothetical protein